MVALGDRLAERPPHEHLASKADEGEDERRGISGDAGERVHDADRLGDPLGLNPPGGQLGDPEIEDARPKIGGDGLTAT